jgi:hypothetical protein
MDPFFHLGSRRIRVEALDTVTVFPSVLTQTGEVCGVPRID